MNQARWKAIWSSIREEATRRGEVRPSGGPTMGNRWLVAYHLNRAGLMRRCGFIKDAQHHLIWSQHYRETLI